MIQKKQNLNRTKAVIICHGKSEYLLAQYIKSNLKLPIEIYAEQNGKSSIQINGLDKVLHNTDFKSKKAFCNRFNFEYHSASNIEGKIFIIMDLDDADEKQIKAFKSGKMFEDHWAKGVIVPIWNFPNYDKVMLEMGIIEKIPESNKKGRIYAEAFPMRHDGKSDIQKIQDFCNMCKECKDTNMEEMLEWLLELAK